MARSPRNHSYDAAAPEAASPNPGNAGGALGQSGAQAAQALVRNGVGATREWLRWFEQTRQIRGELVDALMHNLGTALEEAQNAGDPAALWAIQTRLVSEQWSQTLRQTNALFAHWLDSRARLLDAVNEWAGGAAAAPLPEAAVPASIDDALVLWNRLTRQWIQGVQSGPTLS